ncbi:hypothetical protein N3553_25750, partial [Pantoea dispersa]|uniref:hypothetical protein n=1 Tax=Pantoea dispersa TaxID=59814 RepID=UPI0021B06B6E
AQSALAGFRQCQAGEPGHFCVAKVMNAGEAKIRLQGAERGAVRKIIGTGLFGDLRFPALGEAGAVFRNKGCTGNAQP